jgi:cellulose biosynthesis protein BcsQ
MAAWRTLRDGDTIAVQSGRPGEVERLAQRARAADFDLVLIDNAPGRTGYMARVAGMTELSIILARPSPFDVRIGRTWADAFVSHRFFMVISVAPPARQGQGSPLVRDARQVLRGPQGHVWRRQLTARHSVIQSTGLGMTVIETDPLSPAAQEYSRFWNVIVYELLEVRK